MEKTLRRKATLIITAFLCFALFFASFNAEDVFAAVVKKTVYYDEFNSESGRLDENLIAFGDAKIKTDYTAMRLNSDDYEWGAHIVNGGYKLEYDEIDTSCTVEFVIDKIDEGGAWLAVSYGVENVLYGFPYSSGALIFYSSGSNLFKSVNGALNNADVSGYIRNFRIFQGKKARVFLKFKKVDGEKGYYDLSASCVDVNSEETLAAHNYGRVYVADGYFGFNSSAVKADIYEFGVYEDGAAQPTFYDDFSRSAVAYTAGESDGEPVWYASNFWNRTNLIVGRIGRLDLTKAGSGVVYKEPFYNTDGEGLYLLYSLSADFYVDGMKNSAESGFIIGADREGNGGAFIGVKKNLIKCGLAFRSSGEETYEVGNFTSSVINVKVDVFYDGTAEIIADGESYRFNLNSVSGYMGLKTFGGENAVGAYVDNYSFDGSEYVERKSPDAKVNFEDVKKTEVAGITAYDYYCSSREWYKSNEISLPFIKGDNGYMIFSNAGDYCCFASKNKYSDFIVRFDVKFTVVKSGNIFGIEVGKNIVSASSANSTYVGFQNIGGETYYISNKCVSDEGLTTNRIVSPSGTTENVFVEGATYNFMAIAKNGVITLHVKKAEEPESVLSFVRAKFENVNTDGYVAMFATNGASLQLDNFSIVNLDYEYFTDDYYGGENLETFRYDFSAGKDFGGISTSERVSGNTLKVGDGLSTVRQVGANVTRVRFAEIEDKAELKRGNVSVIIDKTQCEITIKEGDNAINSIPLCEDFVFDGALFEIEETFGKISVSFVAGDKPLNEIAANEYTFEVANDVADKIKINASQNATIKEFSVFNLDTNVSISSGIYVPQEVRLEKPAIKKSDSGELGGSAQSGCSGAINLDMQVLFALGILGVAILIAKGRKNNE